MNVIFIFHIDPTHDTQQLILNLQGQNRINFWLILSFLTES